MKKIVIFASGSGTNAQNIIQEFQNNSIAKVVAVFSNKHDAKVLVRAQKLNVDQFIFSKDDLISGVVLDKINEYQADLIVLAGFLLKFPENIVQKFPNKIINIHPSLLPKYGGKGMYGKNVHQAVFDNKESETGITIHYVNEHYDQGAIILQKSISITHCKSPEEIAKEVHLLEQKHFPSTIKKILTK